MNVFESVIRPVGNSFGVILPQQVMKAQRLKKGQTVVVTLVSKRKPSLGEVFGTLKGTTRFVREHEDRAF